MTNWWTKWAELLGAFSLLATAAFGCSSGAPSENELSFTQLAVGGRAQGGTGQGGPPGGDGGRGPGSAGRGGPPPDPGCGNGIPGGIEECDDGNTLDGDGCSASCLIEYCGDGAVNNGEACDDGNTADGDGCSASCVIEFCGDGIVNGGGGAGGMGGAGGTGATGPTGGTCTGGSSGFGGCSGGSSGFGGTGAFGATSGFGGTDVGGGGFGGTGTGGTGAVGGSGGGGNGEQCDDGNTADGDGCSSTCTVEASSFIHQFGSSEQDFARSVCVDPNGNVIAVGTAGVDIDRGAFVRKLDPNGNVLWSQQLVTTGNDEAVGVDTDESGNIVVAGYTDGVLGGVGLADTFVTKLDPDGNVLWTQQFNGGAEAAFALGVSLDAGGNSFVGGIFSPYSGTVDAFVAKLDPNGALLWIRQVGSGENDYGLAIAADGSGNAIVAGAFGGENQDLFAAKFDDAGNLLWTVTYGTSYNFDYAWGVSVDGSDNVLLAGETAGDFGSPTPGAGFGAYVAKLDPNGDLVWARQLNDVTYDIAYGVVTDGAGNVFAAGSAGSEDVFVSKLDTDGNEILKVEFGTDQPDTAWAIALDAAGHVIVAGDTKGDLGGPNLGINDAFVLKTSVP